MTSEWYESTPAAADLTQGELIYNCPALQWNTAISSDQREGAETLKVTSEVVNADLIVMSQACDLAQRKILNVILCPIEKLSAHRTRWEDGQKAMNQNVTAKSWRKYTESLENGYLFDLAILDRSSGIHLSEHIVVDFSEVFSIPREFLDSLIAQRNAARVRLLPPYREHLSQSFARFFMRVGLPTKLEAIP